MSKLTTIKQALETNALVDVVEELRMESLPSVAHPHHQGWVIYRVAPKVGLYSVKDLQAFMLSLVPGMEPSSKDDFYEGNYANHGTYLRFGKLVFAEAVGQMTICRKLVLTDDDYKAAAGKEIIEVEETLQITRAIFIHVYPSREISVKHRNALDISYDRLAECMPPPRKSLARLWFCWLGAN